jgi:hypothetical protein
VNFKYDYARELFLTKQINWLTDEIRLLVVDGNYIPLRTHQTISNIPPSAIVRRSEPFTGKTAPEGYARALPVPLFSLVHGQPITGVVIYLNTGDDTSSVLLAYVDDGIVFPMQALGFDYYFAYDATEGGFFRT